MRSVDEATVRDYCDNHPLRRPPIPIAKSIGAVVVAEMAVMVSALSLHRWFGIGMLPSAELANAILFVCFAKRMAKGIVLCYQRYAPDSVRRRCSCMPSCSEYALLALDKYSWPKAFWKIGHRLFCVCGQAGYHADYP